MRIKDGHLVPLVPPQIPMSILWPSCFTKLPWKWRFNGKKEQKCSECFLTRATGPRDR